MQENVPEFRFGGYTDAWEQRKLGDLIIKGGSGGTPKSTIKKYYGGNIPFLSITDLTNSNGYIEKTEKTITEEGLDNSAAWIVPQGSISLAMYASVGKVAILNIDTATSQAFYNLIFEEETIRDFTYQRLVYANETNEWGKLVSTGTQSNLNAQKVKSFEVRLPQNKGELSYISNLHKLIDHLIRLQQRELDYLKETKKTMLSELFPKKSETIPGVRFEGFTDAWKQRKLKDIAIFRRGSFPQPYGDRKWYGGEGALPFVQVADITDNMDLVRETKQKISKVAQPLSVYAEKNTVLVTLQGSIGRVAIMQYGAFIDRTVLIFEEFQDQIEIHFWAHVIKQKFIEEARRAPGGTIKTITKEVLSDFNIMLTNYDEQQSIGSFFSTLDHLITLQQRKLDLLKSQKQTLLKSMFPR